MDRIMCFPEFKLLYVNVTKHKELILSLKTISFKDVLKPSKDPVFSFFMLITFAHLNAWAFFLKYFSVK
jgi:hypothetical protein